jgi:uncharacterized membrane protein
MAREARPDGRSGAPPIAHDGDDMTERRGPFYSESNRVEAFSDGVFAIAITLLVLELAIPATSGHFTQDLGDEWVSYVAYLAAFANIGVLWLGHHTVFTRIRAVDTGVLWRNLVLLLTVSVVPFPTAVIASAYRVGTPADQAAAVVAYAVVGMGSGVAWLLLFEYMRRHPDLSDPLRHDDFWRPNEPLITLFGYAIAALIGWFVSPSVALAIFLLFPIVYVVRVRSAEHREE